LNFDDFYWHNKIQEHFTTHKKYASARNATNKIIYLPKKFLEFCFHVKIRVLEMA
jgi:hypothetical protein